ncbi:MAG TPA: MerR family transcriptional regulator [Acidimicrobiales bacterium]|jgi:DNA-binding transcriptional MerR regulator|nr:MerR family transcriptional regulator [Acidimicrobiales bacterium]
MAGDRGMTIDELAARAGVTSRNIRAYQTRGLLPPPRMEGRVGYYDDGHLSRLQYVGSLQERGFSLASIQCLLDAWEEGRGLPEVLGFEEALTAPFSDEKPERMSVGRLLELFPEAVDDPGLVTRAVELGLLAATPDADEFVAPSPRLVRVGAELCAAGIPLAATLDEYERLAADAATIAERFVALFEANVWEPYVAAGLPPERLGQVTEALQRARPMAAMAMEAALARAMEAAVAASAARQMARFLPGGEVPG